MRTIISILLITIILFLSCNSVTERIENYSVHGIDVSHYQSRINWDTVATQKIDFVFVKATEGETIADSLFCNNWSDIKRVGLIRGAYHFFRPSVPAASQAFLFMDNVNYELGDLPPVLDVEVLENVSSSELVQQMKDWLSFIESHYNTPVIIYSNLNFYLEHLAGHFDNNPIWIARYSDKKPKLKHGQQWDFWQYGNRGRMKGINGDVDFNVFSGTLEELDALRLGYNNSSLTSLAQ